jgi:TctA family transporter
MVIATIFDGVKTVMVIIGVFAILRIMRTVMATKHAQASVKKFDEKKKQYDKYNEQVRNNQGKVRIDTASDNDAFEDVEFEELR